MFTYSEQLYCRFSKLLNDKTNTAIETRTIIDMINWIKTNSVKINEVGIFYGL